MAIFDREQLKAINDSIAQTAAQFQAFERDRESMAAHQRAIERTIVSPPVVKLSADSPLNDLVETMKAQNELLSQQVSLFIEENERQKAQIEAAKDAEEQAKKEALHSRVFNWITFGVTTAFSAAALVISIIALL